MLALGSALAVSLASKLPKQARWQKAKHRKSRQHHTTWLSRPGRQVFLANAPEYTIVPTENHSRSEEQFLGQSADLAKQSSMLLRRLKEREVGRAPGLHLPRQVRAAGTDSLALSKRKDVVSKHNGGVNCLQVDLTESRYLLSGASDGSLALCDTFQASCYDGEADCERHEPLITVGRGSKQGHKYAVSCVQWYPIDTGLFASGSFDQKINLWDTNTVEVVLHFKFPGKVYAIEMSAMATSHTLLAAGTESPQVRLCDLSSGAFTHTLSGHRDGVWALQWSASSEWLLYTGSCDGAVRVWDIRRAGCLQVLDQQKTQTGRRPPIFKKSVARSPSAYSIPSGTSAMDVERHRVPRMSGSRCNTINGFKKKELESHRQHPGTARIADRSTSHNGEVVALQTTPDGMSLFSAGTDSRVRLWDLDSNCNTLVNYEKTSISSRKGTHLAVALDASLVYVPKASTIQVHDIWTGKVRSILRGHYDQVNCCVFGLDDQELFSGGSDRRILVWRPPYRDILEEEGEAVGRSGVLPDVDSWSD